MTLSCFRYNAHQRHMCLHYLTEIILFLLDMPRFTTECWEWCGNCDHCPENLQLFVCLTHRRTKGWGRAAKTEGSELDTSSSLFLS